MRILLIIVLLILLAVFALRYTGGILVGVGEGRELQVNGRTVVAEQTCRYFTGTSLVEVPAGAQIGGVTVQAECPLFYNSVQDEAAR